MRPDVRAGVTAADNPPGDHGSASRRRAAGYCAGLAVAVVAAGAGCSSGGETAPATQRTTATQAPPLPARPVPPEAVEVSPGGVTTRVDVPADATESQYGQACHAAKLWMDEQTGDPRALVEPYLTILQRPGPVGPGSFNTPWAELTPAQQAAVIMAVNGAANEQCE